MSDYQLELAASAERDTSAAGTESTKGGGAAFNIEPQHVILQYIICAKPQGT